MTKILFKLIVFTLICMQSNFISGQETLPIYSDYLSDNVYLVHPSAAGIGNCGKIQGLEQLFLMIKMDSTLKKGFKQPMHIILKWEGLMI
jgi:hypothetical protein